jgi:hypothetical protein
MVPASRPGNSNNVKLEKIEPSWSETELQGVTVVFVAVNREAHPHRQCVVGWYRKATVYRLPKYSPSRIREGKKYIAVARVTDSVLLKPDARKWWVKAGTDGIGEANVCYLYHDDGRRKRLRWQNRILKKIEVHRPHREA